VEFSRSVFNRKLGEPIIWLTLPRWQLDLQNGFRLTIGLQINKYREFGNFPRFGPIDSFFLGVRGLA
jgi:hypothetical protein